MCKLILRKIIYIDNKLENNRKKLLEIDKKIIELLGKRFIISKEIGKIKINKNIEPLQTEYWNYTEEIRQILANENNVNPKLVNKLFNLIRKESLKEQKK